jgi:hypothetical protein
MARCCSPDRVRDRPDPNWHPCSSAVGRTVGGAGGTAVANYGQLMLQAPIGASGGAPYSEEFVSRGVRSTRTYALRANIIGDHARTISGKASASPEQGAANRACILAVASRGPSSSPQVSCMESA